jgi:predicted NUDIX family NTP pyrophosphohydrolase
MDRTAPLDYVNVLRAGEEVAKSRLHCAAMPDTSAGILLYRGAGASLEVLLVHPGGPLWARRDLGAWSIPKGEHEPDEEPLAAARREFAEELGCEPPPGEALALGEVRQRGGKRVRAFALEGDLDTETIHSNEFELEWPPRSGLRRRFPEVERAAWFALEGARERINPAQAELLDRLAARLS